MTPEEIATLLDLPESVRAALVAVDGPGWFVSRNNDGTDAKATPLGECPGDDLGAVVAGWGRTWAWCPADTFEIVRLATPLGSVWSRIVERYGLVTAEYLHANCTHAGMGRSPRLAALRLLASVST